MLQLKPSQQTPVTFSIKRKNPVFTSTFLRILAIVFFLHLIPLFIFVLIHPPIKTLPLLFPLTSMLILEYPSNPKPHFQVSKLMITAYYLGMY